jgi:thermitase
MNASKMLIAFAVTATVYATAPKHHSQRLIVKTNGGAPQHELISNVKHFFGNYFVVYSNNIEVVKSDFDYFAGRSEKLPTPQNPHTLEKSTKSGNEVFNDPGLSRVWAFKDADDNGMGVTKAYVEHGHQDTEPVIVAVVDTGVDYNHEDLKDVMWTNQGEIPGNGIDDDGNGYIDDIHGINTLVRDSQGNATSDMSDTHSHGTHVSGTIAAKQNNSTGIAGVASNVRIMGIRTVPNNGDETDVDVAEAYLYAARNGAKIINCSFGKSHNEGGDLVKDTIDHIGREYGVLVVTSAGNSSANIDRRLTYPASFETDYMIVIASSTKSGRMSYFSNYGKKNVDIAAPGSSVYSTVPGNRYSNMSGTSMASPNLSGVAAEILSRHPELGPIELKQRLMSTVTEYSSFKKKMQAGGVVNLHHSLNF